MQIVCHLDRVKWLEECLNEIAQADDNDIDLVDGLCAESNLAPNDTILLSMHCVDAIQAYFVVIVGVGLVILGEGMIAHEGRQIIDVCVRCVQVGGSRFCQRCVA